MTDAYRQFLERKVAVAPSTGVTAALVGAESPRRVRAISSGGAQ